MEEKLHKNDFATFKEYNRERMRRFNHKKHMKDRLDKFYELIQLIRSYEEDIEDDSFIALKLAGDCKYKLVLDKDLEKCSS